MLENIEGEHAIESIVAKWERMRVVHHVGMPENLPLQLDAVWIFFSGRPSADVKNKFIPFAKYHFEIRTDRI